MATAKEGWVHKQSKGLTKGWSKKYCILQYNLLLIFDKEPSGSSRGQPKKSYNLSDCTIRPAEGLHSFGFQVILPGGKSIALAGLNANDLKEWTEKIKEASKPAPPSKNIEQKIPDRWEVTSKPNDNKKNGGGGGGGGLAERVPAQQQPPIQQYQPPIQQYQPPVQQYQPPVQQYQPPVQHQKTQQGPDYSAFLNAPNVPAYNPSLNLPSVPQTQPQSKPTGTVFPNLRQYG